MAQSIEAETQQRGRLRIDGYDVIDAACLETFPFESPGSGLTVDITTDEFTALCPWSGLPDFGTVAIRYLPEAKILELKSFKLYLLSYRTVGIYQEHAVTRMLNDLVKVVDPQWMEIVLDYRVRGGIHTVCKVRWPR